MSAKAKTATVRKAKAPTTKPRVKAASARAGRGKRTPHVLVLRAPGTNCDRETAYAFEQAGATTTAVHVNALLASPRQLESVDGFVLPGGFSYGDDLGAGAVLGTMLRTKLGDPLKRLVDRGGIVLGICNGFQVLVRTGLLPGWDDESGEDRLVALASNAQNRYEDRWVTLEATSKHCVFVRPGDRLHVPVAHAEGRFVTRDPAVRQSMVDRDLVALRYVAPKGVSPAPFPFNPNGAEDDIAGITDPTGRVLGLMPHPERNQLPWQDPRFHRGDAPGVPDGRLPFRRAVQYLERR
ncbi:MAG: phosphoribosylformylglycinamidine synthase I [Planctomycetes bacterium]|nr:phosphoribosylformylglycinamidine synthase I [Planctomycetota bacterium]MCB9830041.1 phosphoribosylformylglycinamidine synthase I [Planctomycetota bacterium]MCB9902077.1 phosphoribosylformylglycinamidine synthase I [Planctomycetota bacterium]